MDKSRKNCSLSIKTDFSWTESEKCRPRKIIHIFADVGKQRFV
jgi:hypothetical protein